MIIILTRDNMNPYIEIIRPGNAIMSAIVIILVAIIDRSFNLPIFLAMLAVFFETAAGNVINDYFDYFRTNISKKWEKLWIPIIYSWYNLRFSNKLLDQ